MRSFGNINFDEKPQLSLFSKFNIAATINGIDLYENREKLKGIIGNVSQADLLIEELSVFENLFFSAELSIRDISKIQLYRKWKK